LYFYPPETHKSPQNSVNPPPPSIKTTTQSQTSQHIQQTHNPPNPENFQHPNPF
jgi:hypothetical protein